MELKLSRRQALVSGAALPLAAALAGPARAQAEMLGEAFADHTRVALGDFEVTTILAGTRTVPNPHDIFGLNASDEEFAAAAEAAFIPADKAQFFFTPTLVNTGSELILFDTGLDGGAMAAALTAAGIAPESVDKVVITHMHGDHIGGLMGESGPTFANATYVTGAIENNHWSAQNNEGYEAKVRPLLEKFTFIDDGGSVAPGITGMLAAGHTPGHMVYQLESGGQRLMITADTANHYVWSLAHPEWEVSFDNDKAMAAESRKKVFGMIAADRIPFVGYHMPFPALGYVAAEGEGFRYVPTSYQFRLDES